MAQYGVSIQAEPGGDDPEDSDSAEIRALLADEPEFSELPAEYQRQVVAQIAEALSE